MGEERINRFVERYPKERFGYLSFFIFGGLGKNVALPIQDLGFRYLKIVKS
jgi:hypothetical protein